MTILAGIVSRSAGDPIPDADRLLLAQVVSRQPGELVQTWGRPGAFFAKVDIGAFGAPAWTERPDGSIAMLAGEPLLAVDRMRARTRSEDLAVLHEGWSRGDDHAATRARWVFCAAHYAAEGRRLTLITDKTGIRPMYYWVGEDRVVFASALRVLEALPFVPKVADLRGVTELACLGAPLGDRTPYADIRILRSAEVMRMTDGTIARSQYWRWDRVAPSRRPEGDLIAAAHQQFLAAVTARLQRDRTVTAYLSGGLDSRAVVAALLRTDARVRTFNFSVPRTQDRTFAAQFARVAGTIHHESPMTSEVELRFSTMLARALAAETPVPGFTPDRPRIAWSGDGGSACAGHVYQSQAVVDGLRAGDREAAITAFLDHQQARVVGRLFQPRISAALSDVPRQGMREEFDDIHAVDPGRTLYLFVLLNDQRRHMATHFENLDLDRLELEFPFFDSDFLEAILETPIDLCLYHRWYMRWLALFSPSVTSVPWQAYPDHVPCPLPIPKELGYQWQRKRTRAFSRPRRQELLHAADEMLRAPQFPDDTLRKGTVRLASWISRLALGDYEYVLRHASLYYRYWRRSGGRWTMTDASRG